MTTRMQMGIRTAERRRETCLSHSIPGQTPQSHENATVPGVVHGARGVCVVDKDAFEVADGSDSVIVDRSVW